MERPDRIALLGAEVDLITPAEVMEAISRFASAGQTAVIANHNAHSLYLIKREPQFAAFFRGADLIEIDSRPLILWGRLLGFPVHARHRCTYLDWRADFWSLAEQNGWRVFYLGGAPGTPEAGAERLRQRWPGLNLAVRNGYFDARPDSEENLEVVAQIRAFDPHVVLVGMGMPRQEAWIYENRAAFRRGVFMPVGAAMDYEAGVQSVAPRWLGPLGLEWLYRLASQPRRLAFRYLVEPWSLLPAMGRDVAARLKGSRGPRSAQAVGAANGRR